MSTSLSHCTGPKNGGNKVCRSNCLVWSVYSTRLNYVWQHFGEIYSLFFSLTALKSSSSNLSYTKRRKKGDWDKMLLKNYFEISIWNKNLEKIFFTPEHWSCSFQSKEEVPNQVEIVHLSSNTLQTFRKNCVNAYVPQLIDFRFLLLRIL